MLRPSLAQLFAWVKRTDERFRIGRYCFAFTWGGSLIYSFYTAMYTEEPNSKVVHIMYSVGNTLVATSTLYSHIQSQNSYLCTYNSYVPERNAFDAGSIHYMGWGKWEGVGPPTCTSNGCCPHQKHQKHYAQGRINHSCIGGFMYKSSHWSFQGP